MNGVRVLTAQSAGSVDRVRRSPLSDRSFNLFNLYLFVLDVVCGSYFCNYGASIDYTAFKK